MFIMIDKVLKLKLTQVLNNSRIKNNDHNSKISYISKIYAKK